MARKHLSLVASADGTTTKKLPAPLVPPDVNLQDFAFMPLESTRLFASEFHASTTDGEWRAGVTLWCKSWHQTPAGSLPSDDASLTRLAELGRDVDGWKAVKTGAMRNWVLCADGRLYHHVIAAKALCVWIERLISRRGAATGNQRRWGSPGATTILDRQLTNTLRSLKKLHGENKADDGVIGAIDKAERLLSKSAIKTEGLEPSLPDRATIAPQFDPRSQEKGEGEGEREEKERGAENAGAPSPGSGDPALPLTPSKPRRRGRPAKDDTAWPDDFALTPEMAAYATKLSFDPTWLFEKFRNKALAKGWTYRDWPAGFRTFAMQERSFASSANGARPASPKRAPDV